MDERGQSSGKRTKLVSSCLKGSKRQQAIARNEFKQDAQCLISKPFYHYLRSNFTSSDKQYRRKAICENTNQRLGIRYDGKTSAPVKALVFLLKHAGAGCVGDLP